MKSSVLGVGTELTDGQIINRNAAWLGERLKTVGLRCDLHFTVPDDRQLILEGLDLCARHSAVLFVTGGLGPTSDDFTRDMIAEWAGLKMKFDEASWKKVEERLLSRGFRVENFQRQQCYFPEGAVILENSQGTANGFRLRARDREIVVLPGPPREIEAIWNDHLFSWATELGASSDPVITRSWDLIGLGESQVVTLAEPLLGDTAGFEVGYRVHLPFVEFKLSFPRSAAASAAAVVERLEAAFAPHTVTRDGLDLAVKLASLITGPIEILDQVSGSFLLQRIVAPFRSVWSSGEWRIFSSGEFASTDGLQLWIQPIDEHSVRVGRRFHRQTREIIVDAPMRKTNMSERRKQYFVEMALAWWCMELES